MCAMNVASLALVCLAAMSFAPVQEKPKEPPSTLAQNRVLEQLQGAWKLRKIDHKGLIAAGRLETGYMVVSGSHMALEIHIGYAQDNGDVGEPLFQTGVYAAEVDKELNLVLKTLIGSQSDRRYRAVAEQPGRERRYKSELVGATLTLRRDDGAQFIFDRQADRLQVYDFYGRKLPQEKADGAGAEPKKP